MSSMQTLAELLERHSRGLGDGVHDSIIPSVDLVRGEARSERLHTIYRPSVCIIAQGAKRVIAGTQVLDYGVGQYLTTSVEMPVLGQVMQASFETPYLCIAVELEPSLLTDVMLESVQPDRHDAEPDLGMQVSAVSPEIIDAAVRLLGLLDRPHQIAALAPLYERELAYFLLSGPQGARLRQMATRDTQSAQIAKAIRWISQNYREAINIDDAAAQANMSASAFFQHFKSVTALSPLQFQKQLRLQEARRLLVTGEADAASASFAVGYASPQQFSREYSRLFGAPPQRDVSRLRESGALSA